MRRFALLVAVPLVTLAAATNAEASCDWVNDVTTWEASVSWSWSNAYSWTEPAGGTLVSSFEGETRDAGSATASISGSFTSGFFLGSGDAIGSLSFLDRVDFADPYGSGFFQTALNGPLVSVSPPIPPIVSLDLDTQACTYQWGLIAYGEGIRSSTYQGDIPVSEVPGTIVSGTQPIPSLRGALGFDGPVRATSKPLTQLEPWFAVAGEGAFQAENYAVPPDVFEDAFVHWSFVPGGSSLPSNDSCAAATFLFGSASQDVSLATDAATDPGSACGAGDRSVWFFFLPEESGTAQISTSGSGYSTVVSVWPLAQTCGALTTEVACGADGGNGGSGTSVPVQQGVPLYVQVRRSAPAGTGDLQIQLTPEPDAAAVVACGVLAFLARVGGAGRRR
jgi:hypothetical protein